MIGVPVFIHGSADCDPHPCPYHRPSSHHMRMWPRNLRRDWPAPFVERLCSHGIGHPDPDSMAWLVRECNRLFARAGRRRADRVAEAQAYGVHGCDGCCTPPTT